MATQEEVDAIATKLQTVSTDIAKVARDLDTAKTTIQGEIDALASRNPSLDVTALQAAADALDPAVQALDAQAQTIGALTPTPPPAA